MQNYAVELRGNSAREKEGRPKFWQKVRSTWFDGYFVKPDHLVLALVEEHVAVRGLVDCTGYRTSVREP